MGTNITFTEQAFEEYLSWQGQDRKTLKKINALLKDICRSPFEGIGKPEPLKENLSGYRGLWLAGVLGAVNGRLPRLDCFTLCLERSTKFILCLPNLFADTIHHENIAIGPISIFQFVDARVILLCHLQIPLVDFFVAKSQIPACEKCPLVDKEISCIFLFFASSPAPNGEAVWLLPGRVLRGRHVSGHVPRGSP